jgi:hypothetical protein
MASTGHPKNAPQGANRMNLFERSFGFDLQDQLKLEMGRVCSFRERTADERTARSAITVFPRAPTVPPTKATAESSRGRWPVGEWPGIAQDPPSTEPPLLAGQTQCGCG